MFLQTPCSDKSPGVASVTRPKHAGIIATSAAFQSTTSRTEGQKNIESTENAQGLLESEVSETEKPSTYCENEKLEEETEPTKKTENALDEEKENYAEGCGNYAALLNAMGKQKSSIVSLEKLRLLKTTQMTSLFVIIHHDTTNVLAKCSWIDVTVLARLRPVLLGLERKFWRSHHSGKIYLRQKKF